MTSEVTADTRPAGLLDLRWIALIALTVLFGMQSLRALMPLVVFVLRDRFGWSAEGVGLAMLTVLATGFLATPALRAAGARRFLWLTAGGLGPARLALQLWTGDPSVDLGLAITATMLFFFALPALLGEADRVGSLFRFSASGTIFALGWLTGLAADSALHGAYGTWDMSWRSDPATLVIVLVLVAVHWRLLAFGIRFDEAGTGHRAGNTSICPASTWAAIGPLLFLELLVLGNVARLITLTGWDAGWGAMWVVAGRVSAMAVVVSLGRGGRPAWPSSALLASALVASFVVPWPRGIWAALLQLAGLVLAAVLWTSIVATAAPRRTAAGSGSAGPKRLAVSHGLGLMTFCVLLFLYYAGIDIRLPFSRDLLPPIAALALGGAAVAATRKRGDPARRPGPALKASLGDKRGILGVLSVAALLALPAARLLVGPGVQVAAAAGFPLRVMTYNLHLCVDPRGHLDLEEIAATIEAEHPDLVVLQEVARGWVTGGSADTLTWLSRRLGMSYLFAATADPLWGNAILSRRPLLDHQALDLPSEDLLIRRGFLYGRVDLGEDGHFDAIVTHHHHRIDGSEIRQRQSRAILDFWQGRGRTAILGDFNARPGEPEIEMMHRAGLGDVLDLANIEPGLTYPALAPVKRIDYIWITPDLAPRDVAVPSSPASDHLPVVVTLDTRGDVALPPGAGA